MKLLIRADANNYIATGHVMRCISIAQVAIAQGHEVKFVIADLDGAILLEKYNMDYICLYTIWNQMDEEIEKVSEIIDNEKPDFILVDSYYVTLKYLSSLRMLCKVAYIDDLNRFIYPCDILICYANYYKKFRYEERYPLGTKLLLGPKYAPLRQVFSVINSIKKKEKNNNILIMSGGTDEYHVIKKFLYHFNQNPCRNTGVNINAICGVYNADYKWLTEKYSTYSNINIFRSVDDIEKFMLESDVVISAGGSTLYELCACGTPTICYSFADNQIDNVKSFDRDGLMIYAGDVRDNDIMNDILNNVFDLLGNEEKRALLQSKMRETVDGKGSVRIVEALSKLI